MIFNKKYTPRWIILLIDLFICVASVTLSYQLRFNFEIPVTNVASLYFIIPFVAGIRLISFVIGRTFAGIVRYSGIKDMQRIFFTNLAGSIIIITINIVSYKFHFTKAFIVPLSIVIMDFIITVFFMTSIRLVIKAAFHEYRTSSLITKQIIIYGTGPSGIAAKQTMEQDIETRYKIVAFIDDIESASKKKLENIKILPVNALTELIEQNKIEYLLLAKSFKSKDQKRDIVDICLNNNIKVLSVPSVENWINGQLSSKQIRNIKIEELLERDPINLDIEKIKNQITGKVVMVTGAAGSIGSEMVRQLIQFKPKNLILFDQAESPLYDIELEIKESGHNVNYSVIIGDIADKQRVAYVFETFKPEIIYHAAAYKHVPMMENNPAEAIKTNVLGTKTIADMAVKHKTNRFVMVSTDKAVNPTNVMGASKRIAEIYTQSLNNQNATHFITTRFGNVLGSNGSVIPRFKRQIETGGPITVTHPNITRFFMTIPEACQLVLEAGAMGKGGEIFIFDMGKSVKIVDLAKKMIKLSGLQLGKDIQINYTGLRPGEKLYEELLADKENTLPTHHSQIMIGKVRKYQYNDLCPLIDELIGLIDKNEFEIVKQMKKIVPEFISQNSIYEQLDKPIITN